MSGHVGDRLSALVDGELDHDERDQVLAHVTCCPSCKEELEAERRVHALVGSLGDEERAPAPSGDMLASLLRLGEDAVPDGSEDAGSDREDERAGSFRRTHLRSRPGEPEPESPPAPGRRPGRPAVGASTRPARLGRSGSGRPGIGRPGPGRRASGRRPSGRSGAGGFTSRDGSGIAARLGRPGAGRSGSGRSGGAGRWRRADEAPDALAGAGPTTGASLLRSRSSRRLALGVAGAASAFGMTAALAFTLNGAPGTAPQVNVTPPAQQMGVEDAKIIPEYPAPGSRFVTGLLEPPEPTGSRSGSVTPRPVQDEDR